MRTLVTKLDALIKSVVRHAIDIGRFKTADIARAVMADTTLVEHLRDMASRYAGWEFAEIIRRYVYKQSGDVLRLTMDPDTGRRLFQTVGKVGINAIWIAVVEMTRDDVVNVIAARTAGAEALRAEAKYFQKVLDFMDAEGVDNVGRLSSSAQATLKTNEL